ncbi:MFS transporter [Porticoccaceae bacterium]|nr:MFS transporter [Porticoccaceae bacterium]
MAVKSNTLNDGNPRESQDGSLSLSHCLSFSAPQLTVIWLGAPIQVLQGIYAKYYGFTLATLASIVLLARLFDAISDPLIGHYSDRYHRRFGTRKPFLLVGGLLLVFSAHFLYVPVGGHANGELGSVSVTYFVLWFMVVYLAMTLFEIPHAAWASELARTSADKAKIFSYRSVSGLLGMACFYLVPVLPFFETHDITPETLEVSVTAAGVLMLPLLYICIKNTPNSTAKKTTLRLHSKENKSGKNTSFRHLFDSLLGNRPLVIFFGAFLAYGFGVGMWFSLVFLYVDGYLGLGKYFAQVFLLSFTVGIIATPAWCKLAIVFGKKVILSGAMILLIISFLYAGMLEPEVTGFWELLILQITNILGGTCMVAFAPALLSEIIDYGTWKYRIEQTATYYALFTFLGKLNIAVGGALGLAIAGFYGFDATTAAQTSDGIRGILIGMAWLPIIFIVIALVLIVLNPIDTRRHGIIRRCLDARIVRENRDANLVFSKNIATDSLIQKPRRV